MASSSTTSTWGRASSSGASLTNSITEAARMSFVHCDSHATLTGTPGTPDSAGFARGNHVGAPAKKAPVWDGPKRARSRGHTVEKQRARAHGTTTRQGGRVAYAA